MIGRLNIGIDVVDVNRFKKLEYHKNIQFYKKIFAKSEINYCIKYKNAAEHFAGKFAIKEAVKKSINQKIKMIDIITSHSNTKPKVRINSKSQYNFQISISHEKNIAIGVVISELCKKS
jgi:holo-[acyl-carrier protein] synthase